MAKRENIKIEFGREFCSFGEGEDRVGICQAFDQNGNEITLKGKLSMGDMVQGLEYELAGRWYDHPKFGMQFWFQNYALIRPHSKRGIIRYIMQVPKIGTAIATRIFKEFDEKSIDMLRENPESVATRVDGLNKKLAKEASAWLSENEIFERTKIQLFDLLDGRGFPRNLSNELMRRFGVEAPERIRECPYILMEFNGVGFLKADRLYLDIGGDPAAIQRQALCCWHHFSGSNGDTWMPMEAARGKLGEQVSSAEVKFDEAIDFAITERMLVKHCDSNGKWWVSTVKRAKAEKAVAERVVEELTTFEPEWPDMLEDGVLTPHQRGQLSKSLQGTIGLFTGAAGTGKAQPLDSKILTPDGWIKMGEARIGEAVIGSDGKTYQITGVFPQGKKDVYRVTMSDGSSTECCKEHLWLTQNERERDHGKNDWSVKDTEDLMGSLTRKSNKQRFVQKIPMATPAEFEKKDLPIHPYLLGVLLGDGCFRGGSVTVSNPDPFIRNEIKRLIPKTTYLKKLRSDESYDYGIYKSDLATTKTNEMKELLEQLGLFGKKSIDKSIPRDYLLSSPEDRLLLLQGLLDTDGSTTVHCVEYSTSSKHLKDAVKFLVHSLGGTARTTSRIPKYTHNGEVREGNRSYRVWVSLPGNLSPFRTPAKKSKYVPKTKYQPYRIIKSIELVGQKECQCISVSAPNSLYVTDDFIVTHNTFSSIRLIRQILKSYGPSRILACAPTGKARVRMREVLEQAGISNLETYTIHSALGYSGEREKGTAFRHNASNPLPVDWVFIDESSMLDVWLMSCLFDALRPGTHVLFIGDKYQLPPVGHGSPLRDLENAGAPTGELTNLHRNSGRIAKACGELRDRHRFETSEKLDIKNNENLFLVPATNPNHQVMALQTLYRKAIQKGDYDPIWQIQTLAPLNRKGKLARREINKMLQDFLNPNGHSEGSNPFRVGDKIICVDSGKLPSLDPSNPECDETGKVKVANGEMAEVTKVGELWTDAELQNPFREIRIPRGKKSPEMGESDEEDKTDTGCNFDLGYCITSHKGQGSEWPITFILLDSSPAAARVCNREWIYTAISRSKEACLLIGQKRTVSEFCRVSGINSRKTFLAEQIKDGMSQWLKQEKQTS